MVMDSSFVASVLDRLTEGISLSPMMGVDGVSRFRV